MAQPSALEFVTHTPEETRQLGERLGRLLRPGHVVGLIGELGTGKTCLIQGWVRELGTAPGVLVNSPSFTLVQTYPTQWGAVHHIDLYRLAEPEDLHPLGLEELLDQGNLCLVEWPELLVAGLKNVPDLTIRLSHGESPERRHIELEPNPASSWPAHLANVPGLRS